MDLGNPSLRVSPLSEGPIRNGHFTLLQTLHRKPHNGLRFKLLICIFNVRSVTGHFFYKFSKYPSVTYIVYEVEKRCYNEAISGMQNASSPMRPWRGLWTEVTRTTSASYFRLLLHDHLTITIAEIAWDSLSCIIIINTFSSY